MGETGGQQYDPKVVGFLCNWCCYAGADLAGVSRFQYPTNIRVIRVMCSGTIEPEMVLEAFIRGADGVFIGGCHIGDCHYATGNYHTEMKLMVMEKLLDAAGFDKRRLRLEWVSAAEGQRFSEVMKEFTEELKRLGPSEVSRETWAETRPGAQTTKASETGMQQRLRAVQAAAEAFRLRSYVGKMVSLRDDGNVYSEKMSPEELDEILDELVDAEVVRHGILEGAREEPVSCRQLAEHIGVDSARVLREIVVLRRKNLLELDRVEGTTPLYRTA